MAPPFGLTCSASSAQPELAQAGQRLAGEGLVQLDQVEIGDRKPEAVEKLAGRGHRADPHDPGRHAGGGHTQHLDERRQAVTLHRPRRGDDQGGGAVIDAGGVAGRHRPAVADDRLQPGQRLERGVGPRMLVAIDDRRTLPARHLDRHQRAVKGAGLLGRLCPLLRAEREGVLVGAADLKRPRRRSRRSRAWSRRRTAP